MGAATTWVLRAGRHCAGVWVLGGLFAAQRQTWPLQVLEDGGAVREVAAMEGVRSRCVCREEAWGSCVLDVSGQRGLAAVLLRGEVVTLFDVQDEDDEEDMEDD